MEDGATFQAFLGVERENFSERWCFVYRPDNRIEFRVDIDTTLSSGARNAKEERVGATYFLGCGGTVRRCFLAITGRAQQRQK